MKNEEQSSRTVENMSMKELNKRILENGSCKINGYSVRPKTFFIALPFVVIFEICGRNMLTKLEISTAKCISKLFEKDV